MHSTPAAESYIGRLPKGYKPGPWRRIHGGQKTPIMKIKHGEPQLKVGGPIKTTFFVPDAAFSDHLDFAKMMENIFFGATSAIDPKALAKSSASIKAFFKGLRKMAKGYKKITKIQNLKPGITQLKEHIKVRIKHVIPLDYFEVNRYDDVSVADSEVAETSFMNDQTGERESLRSDQFEVTDMVKSGSKTILKTDPNMTLTERVASVKQKMKDLFESKRGIIEDSVKHYGTRQLYNAIEQALPRPMNTTKMPKLSFDAIAKDMRKELHGHFHDFANKTIGNIEDTRGATRKPLVLRHFIKDNATRIRKIREVNDIDNLLAYEVQKRKDKKFQAPVRV